MNVESPHLVTSERPENTLQTAVAQSPPMDVSEDDPADDIDNVIRIAYDEIRRSGSPQLADYIFHPGTNKNSFTHNDSTGIKGLDHILNISMTELELGQLSVELWYTLALLAQNLWNFGKNKYLNYSLHIYEIFLARWRLLEPEKVDTWYKCMRNISSAYLRMGRIAEGERFLTNSIVEINSLRPGHPASIEFQSLLGEVHLRQGNHNLAEELCTQAIISSRANTGLAHSSTWYTYRTLSTVLEAQGRPDGGRRLMMGLYQDIYRTVSAQLLLGLSTCLELCRSYIEGWMDESKLQRILKDTFVSDSPLGLSQTHALTLIAIIHEGYRKEMKFWRPPQLLKDVTDQTGLEVMDILADFALLIARRIRTAQALGSISLQHEALRVLNDLKSTNFLVPLLVLSRLTPDNCWGNQFLWLEAERNLIESLKDVVIDGGHYTKATTSRLSAEEDTSAFGFAAATNLHIPQSEMLNDSERSMIPLTAPDQTSSVETSTGTLGLHNGNVTPSVFPSLTLVRSGSQFPSASIQVPYLVRPDHMASFTPPTTLSWNNEPSVPRSLSPAQSRQVSGDDISHNWFTASTSFSQLPSAAQGGQPFDNALSQTRFSPMMMTTPTPLFMSSLPLTPRSLRMSLPWRPGEDSPDVPPSSILAGRADFPTSPNLLGLPQSPLASSPPLKSDSSPWPQPLPWPMDRSGSSLDGDSSNGTLFQ